MVPDASQLKLILDAVHDLACAGLLVVMVILFKRISSGGPK